MTSRDVILGRVRSALVDVPGDRPAETAPRDYASQQFDDVVGHFCAMVADYRATVHRLDLPEGNGVAGDSGPSGDEGTSDAGDPAAIIAGILRDERADSVVVPHDLPEELLGAIDAAVVVRTDGPDNVLTHRQLDEIAAVVTTSRVGIAATGTVVLDHIAGQGRRALSLVPDLHVCVVSAGQVVADVPDAVGLLDPHRPQTWISGPSATSDIELDRVEGVHGPRRLHVVVVP